MVLDILLRPSSSIKHPQNVVRKGMLTQLNVNHVNFGIAVCLSTWLNSYEENVMNAIYEILFYKIDLPEHEVATYNFLS